MKKLILCFLCAWVVTAAAAQDKQYVLDKKISVTGVGNYDNLAIDKVNNRLYVPLGTTVKVIDLITKKVIGTIGGMQGANGVAIDNNANKGFINDGKASAAIAFDLKTLAKIATIPLSNKDATAIIYNAYSDKVFVFNGDVNNTSLVDPNTMTQTATVPLSGKPEFASVDGSGKIYSIQNFESALKVLDAKTLSAVRVFRTNQCGGPAAVALDEKKKRIFSVCSQIDTMFVTDTYDGRIITEIPIGAGVDAVTYDPESQLIVVSNAEATTTVVQQVSANEYKVIQTITTQTRAKTLALDTKTHKIYLSVAEYEKGTRKIVPGTFTVLVYRLQ